jgi:hypothetical protein
VRELASREYIDLFGRVRISRQTPDRWIPGWRRRVDALVPNPPQSTPAPRRRCWSSRWRCAARTRTAPPPPSSESCAPSSAGHLTNAPCNGTSTGSGSPPLPPGRRGRRSAGKMLTDSRIGSRRDRAARGYWHVVLTLAAALIGSSAHNHRRCLSAETSSEPRPAAFAAEAAQRSRYQSCMPSHHERNRTELFIGPRYYATVTFLSAVAGWRLGTSK